MSILTHRTKINQDHMLRPAELTQDFVRKDGLSDGSLVATVVAYARVNLNVKAAARRLCIHIHTAHHRLARVEERTGYDLRRLADLQELLIAIRLFGEDGMAL